VSEKLFLFRLVGSEVPMEVASLLPHAPREARDAGDAVIAAIERALEALTQVRKGAAPSSVHHVNMGAED
jgi:hypothetical protein